MKSDMKVEQLMSAEVATVRLEDGLDRAAGLMKERDCGCVVVLDEGTHVAGILTDRDVCMTALRTDSPLSKLNACDSMTAEVVTCGPEDTIELAARTMGQHQVRRLPVVDSKGTLRGLLSLDDLAKEARLEKDWILPFVSAESVGKTLAQIGRPHVIRATRP